jgi:hypothetical protein
MNKIAASKVASSTSCFLKLSHQKNDYKIFKSTRSDLLINDGIVFHYLIETFLKKKVFKPNTDEFFELIRSKENTLYEDEKNYISNNFQREQQIINGVKNTLYQLTLNFSLENYDLLLEHSFENDEKFIGTADLILRNEKESIVVDYKSGFVHDKNQEIKDSYKNQMLIYSYLEQKENQNKDVRLFLSDKKGIFHKIDYSTEEINILLNNLNELSSNEKACNNCIFCGRFSESYQNLVDQLNSFSYLTGKLKSVKKTNKDYVIEISGDLNTANNQQIFIQISLNLMEEIDYRLKIGDKVTIGLCSYISNNNDKYFFKATTYFQLAVF